MQPFPGDSIGDRREISSGNQTVSLYVFVMCGNLPYLQGNGFWISTLPLLVSPSSVIGTGYDITCSKKEAYHIKLGQLRGQLPATHLKYKDAIETCGSLDYIECNVSQIARRFGLDSTNSNNVTTMEKSAMPLSSSFRYMKFHFLSYLCPYTKRPFVATYK